MMQIEIRDTYILGTSIANGHACSNTVQRDNFGGDKNSVISVVSLSIEKISIKFFSK